MSGLVSTLSTSIGQAAVRRCVTIGHLLPDGGEQIAIACEGGKVCIFNVEQLTQGSSTLLQPVTIIRIQDEITSIVATPWKDDQEYQLLLITSSSTIQLYDIGQNHSLFHRILPDTIRTVAVGCVSERTEPWVLVGGESSFTGFDKNGVEVYWNVASDVVNTICFVDLIGRGNDQIVVGTVDQEITFFDHEELVDARTELAPVELLTRVGEHTMAYALSNGTIGVYQKLERLWRVKSKSVATCQCFYEPNECLLTGWLSGRWEMRKLRTGEIMHKSQIESAVIQILAHSFSSSGHDLIVFGAEGSIEVFVPPTEADKLRKKAVNENDALRRVEHRREELKNELDNVEQREPELSVGERVEQSIIPREAKLDTKLINHADGIHLQLRVNCDLRIFLVVLLSDGLFGNNESKIEITTSGLPEVSILLADSSSTLADVGIKVAAGFTGSRVLHVLAAFVQVPIFANFTAASASIPLPTGRVEFPFSERTQRLHLWMKDNFLIDEVNSADSTYRFKSSNGEKVSLTVEGDRLVIGADSIKWAADVVQSMASYFGIKEMSSRCEFPEVREISRIFSDIGSIQASLVRIDSDIAEISQSLMSSLVRLEDSRILEDYTSMEAVQSQLLNADSDLLVKQRLRHANRENLLTILKQLNQFIDSGSKLRVGKPSTDVLNICRQAVKNKKPEVIMAALLHGAS